MKTRRPIVLIVAFAMLSLPALAHDPKFHQHDAAAAPDCTKMKDMDMSQMDKNDPVMKALRQKCKGQMDHGDMPNHQTNATHGSAQQTPPAPITDKH